MKLSMSGRIGLIVRGKTGVAHSPGVMQQHADCILGNGEPVGFYGGPNGGRSNGVGMNLTGVVYRYEKMYAERRPYVDLEVAVSQQLCSGILLMSVTQAQSKKFSEYWEKLTRSPGSFDILGDNCSSHASAAFTYAGLVKNGIPGLDTPDNLFRQLRPITNSVHYFGCIGFTRGSTMFEVNLEPLDATKSVSTGSTASPRMSQSQSSGLPSSLNSSNTGSRLSTYPSTRKP